MAAVSRLGKQIAEITDALNRIGARFALIGGLALASHNVIRATQDVDLLADLEKADEIERELDKLGYRRLYRSADAANYARGDERVDLLYASRPIARRLLAGAAELHTSLGNLRVISTEGLIGFKLQGLANDPRRTQDLEDIRSLLRANRTTLDIAEVREYFRLAADGGVGRVPKREEDPFRTLDDLMVVVEALCPVWPQRKPFERSGEMRL